jgi:DNA-binding transcriptional LysR family regulator
MIANRIVDCGFMKLPLDRPELHYEKVVASETICVVAGDNPLSKQEVITPKMLAGQPLILLGLGRATRAQIEAAFDRAGLRPDVRLETHTVGSACALATRGLGIALVNELLAKSYLRPGTAMCKFKPRLLNEYAFVTSAQSEPNRLTREFLKQTKLHFAGSG